MSAIDLTRLAVEIRSHAAIADQPGQCASLEAIADRLDTAARYAEWFAAESAWRRTRMVCEIDCGNCNVCRLREALCIVQGQLRDTRAEATKDYAAIAEKQRRDSEKIAVLERQVQYWRSMARSGGVG